MVTTELRGEKIDIVPYSEDPREFVMRALQPAKVKDVQLDEESGTATVVVNDYQLSLAIGKEGQNARLAARLTGWRIDIKSESQLAEEQAYANEEWAEGEWVQNDAGEMVWQPAGGGEPLSAEEWEAGSGGEAPTPESFSAGASPAGASPAGASPAGASPAGASPAGASPAGASSTEEAAGEVPGAGAEEAVDAAEAADAEASSGDGEVVTVGPEVSASSRDEGAS
jgi:N utilization substance protein A